MIVRMVRKSKVSRLYYILNWRTARRRPQIFWEPVSVDSTEAARNVRFRTVWVCDARVKSFVDVTFRPVYLMLVADPQPI